MTKLEKLLRDTAAREDKKAESMAQTEHIRDDFINGAAELVQSKKSSGSHRTPVVLAAAVAVAAGLGFMVYGLYPAVPAKDSQWVNVSNSQPEDMAFPDGSSVRFDEGSRARVTNITDDKKEVALETGSATLHVVHRSTTDWKVLAGPYTVKVTGTRFSVAWDGEMEYFELNLIEGEVIVTGPMMEKGQVITDGRTLRASLIEERMSVTRLGETDSDPAPGDSVRTNSNKKKKFSSNAHSALSASELLSKANSARTSGDIKAAERSYMELRKRFKGTTYASTSALYLGRMAFDQQRAYGKSVRWLKTYIKEQKSGTLRREAMGLLMEAQRNAGNPDGARQSASRYLELYPAGPHAARAAEIARE